MRAIRYGQQATPSDDEPVTAADIATIEHGQAQTGISLEDFRADIA